MVFGTGLLGAYPPNPATLTYVTAMVSPGNSTSYNFGTQSIGTAFTNRRIVACAVFGGQGASRNATSLTIGGNAATKVVGVAGGDNTGIWITDAGDLDVGTTATVVISGTGASGDDWCGIELYSLEGGTTDPTHTYGVAVATAETTFTGLLPGCAVMGVHGTFTGSGVWTNLTMRSNRVIEGSSYMRTGVAMDLVGSVTFTGSGLGSVTAGSALAAWGPTYA